VEKKIYTIESDLEEGERKEIATGAQRRKEITTGAQRRKHVAS